jgi:hypothetical protein
MTETAGGGASSSRGNSTGRDGRAEGGGGTESRGRAERAPGSRQGSTGSGSAEEQWQSLATGLLGLKLTIPASASIARTASGSSTVMKVMSPLSVFFTLTLAYCILRRNDINTDTICYFRMYHFII